MEKVPAHVHLGPIILDVLTRQHEHRSGLIWSGDHETCITDLQCRYFDRNLFQAYSTTPPRLIDIIDMMRLGGVFTCHILPDLSSLIHVRYINLLEDFDTIDTYSWGSCVLGFRGCTTDRGSPCATSEFGLLTYSCIASSDRSVYRTRPSCSTLCYMVHII
ncbi:hypothetical protein M9H77_02375 [Catharanthus roseus]|uniref:Uncharacterized protein n=1 Tax=Catharanthus roseus TaxID=4058 RepID=A0ACC0C8R2_CATRO|nr:hypothetical protein M9H77_02375 [Catharanthus roseus]